MSVLALIGVLVEICGLLLVPLALVRRREPSSTIAWILTLVFLPGVGLALFLLHGRDRMRWPAKRKRAADAVVAARLDAARTPSILQSTEDLAQMDANERRIFRVCRGLSDAVDVSSGNRVELYTDGDAAFGALERSIDRAERCVFCEFYLVSDDASGARFRGMLVRAANRGLDVRLLVDAYGCFWLPARWYRPLRQAGVKVVQFLPLSEALRLPMNLRTHRKIVVVDGTVAFTGGMNVGDVYMSGSAERPTWRDTLLSIRGPAVAPLTAIFLMDWHFMTGVAEVPKAVFPEPDRDGPAIVAVVPSGPDNVVEAIHRAFFAAIVGARRRIWITTPYFVPDRSLLVALETAALQGVDVQMILPRRSNHRVTGAAGRSFYAELLDCGVTLYEYGPAMIHAKTMLVDDAIALVGSANMDMRSFRLNFEVHTLIHDETVARRLELAFDADRSRSERLDRDRWHARAWPHRVAEGAARLVSPIL
jgi:cardiolipin synthase